MVSELRIERTNERGCGLSPKVGMVGLKSALKGWIFHMWWSLIMLRSFAIVVLLNLGEQARGKPLNEESSCWH